MYHPQYLKRWWENIEKETNDLDCSIKHVFIEANMVADYLSKHAINGKATTSLNPYFGKTKGMLINNKMGLL